MASMNSEGSFIDPILGKVDFVMIYDEKAKCFRITCKYPDLILMPAFDGVASQGTGVLSYKKKRRKKKKCKR
jgi:hypothetical protein